MDESADVLLLAVALTLILFWALGLVAWGVGSLIWLVFVLALAVGALGLLVGHPK